MYKIYLQDILTKHSYKICFGLIFGLPRQELKYTSLVLHDLSKPIQISNITFKDKIIVNYYI